MKNPSYSERVRLAAEWRRSAKEELGLPAEHHVFRDINRFEEFGDHRTARIIESCMDNLLAQQAKADRIGDHVPQKEVFAHGDIPVGVAVTPHGEDTPVVIENGRFPLHWLVCGVPGSGKTTFVKRLLREIVLTCPWISVLLFDPNMSYLDVCDDPLTWLNILWHEVRTNPLRAPIGYPYPLWPPQKIDALARDELANSQYLIQRRVDWLFKRFGVPERDDGECIVPSLYNLRDNLATHRERPGSRDETTYRPSALNVLSGRLSTTGEVYNCARGMEDVLADSRVRIDTHGLCPPETADYFETNLIHYLYSKHSLRATDKPKPLQSLAVLEEAQVLVGERSHSNIPLYQEILLRSRTLGLGFIFVVQDLSSVAPTVVSAISNFAVFSQSSSKNLLAARDILNLSRRESSLLGRLQPGECFIRMVGHDFPFAFLTRITP